MAGWRPGLLAVTTVPKHTPKVSRVPGHPKGSHRKILLFGKNFHVGGPLDLETIFRAQVTSRSFQQIHHLRTVDRSFVHPHTHDEILVSDCGVFSHGIVQGRQVEHLDVIAVGFLHLLRQFPTLGLLAQSRTNPEPVGFGRQVVRIEFQRLPLMRRAFGEAIIL